MSNRKLEKLSADLELLANDFANTYTKLINKFKTYSSAPEINKLEEYWGMAVTLLGKRGTIIEMIDYFIKYKDLILNEKVDELLDMDFTSEIKPGTQTETANLITKLIDIFKTSWKQANQIDQIHIKTYIKMITTKSISIKNILNEIEQV